MTGDNSTAMKENRAYERLLCAIIEEKPKRIIERFLNEATDPGDALKTFEENKKETYEQAKKDATKYYSHRQGGHSVLVLKKSPLGKILARGNYSMK